MIDYVTNDEFDKFDSSLIFLLSWFINNIIERVPSAGAQTAANKILMDKTFNWLEGWAKKIDMFIQNNG